MPPNEDHADRRRTILCIRSRRTAPLLDRALGAYDCRVVHDLYTASRKARLGTFDLYLTVDAYLPAAAVDCWRSLREFDCNTPFLFVLRRPLPPGVARELVSGVDAWMLHSDGAAALSQRVEWLLGAAERRSLEARRAETLAIREDIHERLNRLEWRVQLSRESMARAQEHVMRAYALQSFTRLGGTKSFFERLWPDVYEEALLNKSDDGLSAHG